LWLDSQFRSERKEQRKEQRKIINTQPAEQHFISGPVQNEELLYADKHKLLSWLLLLGVNIPSTLNFNNFILDEFKDGYVLFNHNLL
jgi:hypothetical protein